MAKFYRNSFVIAVIAIALGLGCSIVGVVGGGIGLFRDMVMSDDFSIHGGDGVLRVFGIDLLGGNGEEDESAASTEGVYPLSEYKIDNLQLDIGRANCEIVYEEGADAYKVSVLRRTEDGNVEYGVRENTLYVKSNNSAKLTKIKADKIVITVPEEKVYSQVKIALGAGMIEIEDRLAAKDVTMEIGAGNLEADTIVAEKKFQCEIGAGNLEIDTLRAGTIQAECDAGRIALDSAKVEKDMNIQCNVGAVEIDMEEKENSFNYELSCAMGAISVGEEEHSGMDYSQKVDNKADRTCTVECNMGAVTVDFQ